MFIQIEVGKELQFLAYLIPVIMGIQLAFYFFYQYRKIQDVNLPLNRVLLAFGSFILFMVLGPLFIQISRNFIEKGFLYELVYRIGWGLAFFSTIMVSLFIIKNEFSMIINLRVAKTLMILNIFPILIVFLLPSLRSPIFIVSIFFVVLNGLYIVRFQLILINRSIGSIKKKFKLFLIGALISFIALIFAALVGLGVLPPFINEIVYFTGVGDLFIGFIIMYFSIYNFPPFYEFEWRENLIKLFIINQQNYSSLYSYNFIQDVDKNIKITHSLSNDRDGLFSKGIMGIESIITIITGIKDEKINKIKQGEFYMFLEYGNNPSYITYVLVVRKDLISAHHLLKSIRLQFESFFKDFLLNLDMMRKEHDKLFESFDNIINRILQQ
ncbi:MAG: hypothetical protein ACFFA6_11420 [Promethearchaeota archaeon]